MAELDIVIPVYDEGANIARVLDALRQYVKTPFRVLICYDREEDNTLLALAEYRAEGIGLSFVKNRGRGVLGAVVSGLEATSAPAVLVLPADDDYNASQIDTMVEVLGAGNDVVCASRFSAGGSVIGYPKLKFALVRMSAFALHYFARLPTRDPSNGLRLFSRRVVQDIQIETAHGHAYSIELLVKSHRLGWRICEIPVQWFERRVGTSRFRVVRWLPTYLRWFFYAFATTYLRRGPETVTFRSRPTSRT